MSSAKNVWSGIGGIVTDLEFVDDKKRILNFRLAVDGAGRERDSDDYSGYFDVKYFVNEGDPNGKFVVSQIEAGNIKKGSLVGIVGEVRQERWKNEDGSGRSKVLLVADNITYVGRRSDSESGSGTGSSGGSAAAEKETVASVPSSF